MKKQSFQMKQWAKVCLALSLGLPLTACVDDSYDASKDIDMTMGLGSQGLQLKLGNTENIMLADLLEEDENLKTDAQHTYYLVESGRTNVNFSVDRMNAYIDNAVLSPSLEVLNYSKLQELIPATAGSLNVPEGFVYQINNLTADNSMNFKFDNISSVVKQVKSITPAVGTKLKVSMALEQNGMYFAIRDIDNLKIKLPKYLQVANPTNATIAGQVVSVNPRHNVNSTNIDLAEMDIAKIVLDGNDGKVNGGTLSIPNTEVSLSGDFKVSASRAFTPTTGSKLTLHVYLHMGNTLVGQNEVVFDNVTGRFDPNIAPTIESINIKDNLPDFLDSDDVTIQVLVQAREHLIRKTFEAVKGAPRAVIHFYNSTSVAQREQVFHKSKEEIKQIATDGAKLVKQLSEEYEGNFLFEYSPESFTGTEVDYAVDVCNAVLDIMQPTPDRPMIINLPVTVEMSMPHVYANQIEYCDKHLKYRDSVIISTHPHNDRGTGVACAELAVLAGAQRVECCLFGNGERTGNVDAVTLAMNMYSHGVDPKLDFSDMPAICATYERVTRMHIYERTPYAGQLVFAAFSGSHQDAIAKGMAYRKEHGEHRWTCPYIPVDPHDIGRTYDADVIRINSQSGKGGIGFVLEQNFGYNLPPKMREALGYKVKSVSDHSHKELSANEVLHIFEDAFLNRCKPLNVLEAHFAQVGGITATVTLELNGQRKVVTSVGNGRLDAVANAIQSATGMEFHLETYSEHSLDEGSTSRAASYVGLVWGDNTVTWGAGTDTDIIVAGIKALVSAINNK